MRTIQGTVGQMELLGAGRSEVYMASWKNKRKVWVVGVAVQQQYLQHVDVGGIVLI